MPNIQNAITGLVYSVSNDQLLDIQNNPFLAPLFIYGVPFVPVNQAQNNNFKVLTGLISQSGTNDPTLKLFDNTFYHPIVVTRTGLAGEYDFDNAFGEFTADKTWLYCSVNNSYNTQAVFFRVDDTKCRMHISEAPNVSGNGTDNMLNDTPFEIRVYS